MTYLAPVTIKQLLVALYLVHPPTSGKPRESDRMEGFTEARACVYANKAGAELWALWASGSPDKMTLTYSRFPCESDERRPR